MHMLLRLLAALCGGCAVAIGAYGAHGLSDPQAKAWIVTGVTYALPHAVAALWAEPRHPIIALSWIAGLILFSGSLFAMALGAPTRLGAVAPVGGLLLILGWAMLALTCLSLRRGR